ncbi:MAG: DUF3644 domain-containing protein [Bulleidia sp.]|nr:DUF3644 domain-containing protein [Bulleidia sp.]
MDDVKQRLVDKSVEAFILALEVYNKPTIRYRIEGFSFFICNAWELMLKAELVNKNVSIYQKDKKDRTLSLEQTVKKIYTDKNTRIRLNLERIIELRNISTHYITEDYEAKYAPLFQACVLNFVNEINRFHNVDITKHIAQNFLTITSSYEPLSNEQIILKYSPEVAQKFIQQSNQIDVLTKEYDSDKFAIQIKQNLYITKKKDEADFTVAMEKNSDNKVAVIKELKDPSNTHQYSFSNVIIAVQNRLKKNNIKLGYEKGFNTYVLSMFSDFYNIKSDSKYAYRHNIGNSHHYTYSVQLVEFIVNEIKKNPEKFVESLKKEKTNPRHIGMLDD